MGGHEINFNFVVWGNMPTRHYAYKIPVLQERTWTRTWNRFPPEVNTLMGARLSTRKTPPDSAKSLILCRQLPATNCNL